MSVKENTKTEESTEAKDALDPELIKEVFALPESEVKTEPESKPEEGADDDKKKGETKDDESKPKVKTEAKESEAADDHLKEGEAKTEDDKTDKSEETKTETPEYLVQTNSDGTKRKVSLDDFKAQKAEITRLQQAKANWEKNANTQTQANIAQQQATVKMLEVMREKDPEKFNIVMGVMNLDDTAIGEFSPETQTQLRNMQVQRNMQAQGQQEAYNAAVNTYSDLCISEKDEMLENPEKYPGFNETEVAQYMIDNRLHTTMKIGPKAAYYMMNGAQSTEKALEVQKETLTKEFDEKVAKAVEEAIKTQTGAIQKRLDTTNTPESTGERLTEDQVNKDHGLKEDKDLSPRDFLVKGFKENADVLAGLGGGISRKM